MEVHESILPHCSRPDRLQLLGLTKIVVGLLKEQIKSEIITDVVQKEENFMKKEL